MASVDKAAAGWSIAIVAVAVGIAMAGLSPDSGPSATTPTAISSSDQKIQAAKEQIAKEQMTVQEEERAKAMEAQLGGPSVQLEETVEQEVEISVPTVEVPQATGPMSVDVSIPTGTAVPGCEETNECWLPAEISVGVGGTVTWSNDDTAAHTVTSGSPTDGPDGTFDSSLFMAGATFEVTFDDSGSYDYFCMVHPWMQGNVQVN